MTTYSRERIEAVRTCTDLPPSIRIVPARHRTTPLGVAAGDSRYCSKNDDFSVLYVTPDFPTAFLETVVRDRFTRARQRRVVAEEVTQRFWTTVTSAKTETLNLLNLRGDGCVQLGAPTDAVHARNHAAGRALGRAIHAQHPDIDGFVFASRLTDVDVYAIYDRAVDRLHASASARLADHPDLPTILSAYDIRLEVR